MPRLLLRPAEAAAMLGLSVRTLRRHVPRVSIGGVVGYLPADLEAFLRENRKAPSGRTGVMDDAAGMTIPHP